MSWCGVCVGGNRWPRARGACYPPWKHGTKQFTSYIYIIYLIPGISLKWLGNGSDNLGAMVPWSISWRHGYGMPEAFSSHARYRYGQLMWDEISLPWQPTLWKTWHIPSCSTCLKIPTIQHADGQGQCQCKLELCYMCGRSKVHNMWLSGVWPYSGYGSLSTSCLTQSPLPWQHSLAVQKLKVEILYLAFSV